MKNQVQLITYIDRLSGGGIAALASLLQGPLAGLFGCVHLLPFFYPIDGADAGFDVIDHTTVDPKLGAWNDLRRLGDDFDLMADLIVNHISSQSPQFIDFSHKGTASPYASMFLTYDRVFPHGATEADLLRIYRPRPGLPLTYATFENGEKHLLWTTFTSQQIDIDVTHPQGQAYLEAILRQFQSAGIKAIRLDAVGYAVKKAGTSCFMTDDTFAFIAQLTEQAHDHGMEVLVEVHSHYQKQVEIARHVDWVYDFALPPLVLHALHQADAEPLAEWLRVRPRNAITVLDTHDGIGIIDAGADAEGTPGLLAPQALDQMVEAIHLASNGESRQATGAAANNLDLYQINCTYFDALGRDPVRYLIARALQLFVPGIPQIYYVGLLGTTNDMQLLARTGVGRDINRHYYVQGEVETALMTPMVQQLVALIRLRNSHPAMNGTFSFSLAEKHRLTLVWRLEQQHLQLTVDLAAPSATVEFTPLAVFPGNTLHLDAASLATKESL
jgi:sucrose phosphorylase